MTDNASANIIVSYPDRLDAFGLRAFQNQNFSVHYPTEILKSLSKENFKSILDHFIFCRTTPLRCFFDRIDYKTPRPYLSDFILKSALKDIPRIAYIDKIKASTLIKDFKKNRQVFQNNSLSKKLKLNKKPDAKSCVISFSFGKDSLLTYALLKEIGLKYHLVSFNVGIPNEATLKGKVISAFTKKYKETILSINENTDEIFSSQNLNFTIDCLDYSSGMLAFAFELMPLALHFNSRYIIVGNEKNLDYTFKDKDGCKVYPSYDQSVDFLKAQKSALKKFTNDNLQVTSIIKPIHDIACFKIMATRYPYLLKYMLSCENDPNKQWCENCNMCVRAFLFSAPFIDPKKLGFKSNLFDKKYKDIYVLFSDKIKSPYSQPKEVREEQMLGFFIAYQQNLKGDLIDLFKKRYLKTALRKEKYLRKKFFSFDFDSTIPKAIVKKLFPIFKAELSSCILKKIG